MTLWNKDLHRDLSPIVRYGLSVGCVAVAFGLALILQHYGQRDVEMPLFVIGIGVATWYAGLGPSALAVVLSAACFDYFFTEPLYSFTISTGDLTNFAVFVAWSVVVSSFVTVRSRIEDDLRRTRDELQLEAEQRKQREDEVRRLNRELAGRAAELEASNKELESFAYSVSHDLRAPLRHIAGYSELLHRHASASLDEKSVRYMQTIIEAAKRMGHLIDDLLSFSRIGRTEAKKTLVNLDQLVSDAIREVAQDSKGREIAWKVHPLPACYADRSMLSLVIVNLVSNAVKFTRMRPRAEIEIGSVTVDADQFEVFVRDNGAGFSMQYANKLFGVFQRLHPTEEFEGTGIGLATVQRIIHRHGGKVRAEGAVDQGATFYFSLPRTRETTHKTAERTANTP